ncbi:MAG TPA: hypothetical protein VN238_00160, partial [Solirubrobacteraceae bacterium]|nr:hypothetical protein [Solirubrobacteraceae bacterium]
MSLSPRALAVLAALTALSGFFFAAILGGGDRTTPARGLPVVGSANVEHVASLPGTAAISGVFSRSAPYFYVSGLESVSVFDVSDPRKPKLAGKLVNAIFENEAMTLGERTEPDGAVRRFLLLGNDLGQASVGPNGFSVGRVNGLELIVVDVTDPARPRIAGRTPGDGEDGAVTTSTHTVACVNPACTVAYSAGGTDGKFSIIDLTDLAAPREIGTVKSPAAGEGPIGQAGHHWNIDGAGIAWHTGSGGTAAFDISDPLRPQLLNGTDAHGTQTPYNDFIHHNSQRPNARAFQPGGELSVANGNVVLITEEDYASEGDEVVCSRAGTLQTWALPSLDGAAYRAGNPDAEPNRGTMTPLDTINPPAESGGGLSSPVGAFCSAHWFDFHQSGIVAQGYYQQGLRLVDVRNARELKQFGYVTGGLSEVWDAYWAPERDAAGTVVPGRKTNLVYTVDAVRGVDVFEVTNLPPDLPVAGDEGSRGTFPAAPGAVPAPASATETPAAPAGAGAAAPPAPTAP